MTLAELVANHPHRPRIHGEPVAPDILDPGADAGIVQLTQPPGQVRMAGVRQGDRAQRIHGPLPGSGEHVQLVFKPRELIQESGESFHAARQFNVQHGLYAFREAGEFLRVPEQTKYVAPAVLVHEYQAVADRHRLEEIQVLLFPVALARQPFHARELPSRHGCVFGESRGVLPEGVGHAARHHQARGRFQEVVEYARGETRFGHLGRHTLSRRTHEHAFREQEHEERHGHHDHRQGQRRAQQAMRNASHAKAEHLRQRQVDLRSYVNCAVTGHDFADGFPPTSA